jgi:hypothetical protein
MEIVHGYPVDLVMRSQIPWYEFNYFFSDIAVLYWYSWLYSVAMLSWLKIIVTLCYTQLFRYHSKAQKLLETAHASPLVYPTATDIKGQWQQKKYFLNRKNV